MGIFEQYGIKDVADVTLYSIHKKTDGSNEFYYVPALRLDTLKISSTEETSSDAWARGGVGNSRLIGWDYEKDIQITLQDALCSPASLSLCWGGILSSDWKDGEVNIETASNSIERISRIEKFTYPHINKQRIGIGNLLPKLEEDKVYDLDLTCKSTIIDTVDIRGDGTCHGRVYKWKMAINSAAKAISQIPDRFYDESGKMFNIDMNSKVTIFNLPHYVNKKVALIYKINKNQNVDEIDIDDYENNIVNEEENRAVVDTYNSFELDSLGNVVTPMMTMNTCYADYLAVIIDDNNEYKTYLGKITEVRDKRKVLWYCPTVDIDTFIFKGLDLHLHFSGVNSLVYFLITKYKDNIVKINGNKLWAYINKETLVPYDDSYWLTEGEVYLQYSLTLAQKDKELKGKTISIKAGQFPGTYMMTGESYVKDTEGNEKHFQVEIPCCKVKAEQSIELEAGGDPAIFDLSLDVIKTKNDKTINITIYETTPKMELREDGNYYLVDGSNEILSE